MVAFGLFFLMSSYLYDSILVCGGGGYIGSFVTRAMEGMAAKVVVVDDFSNGHRDALKGTGALVIEGDVCNREFLRSVFEEHRPALVVHLCSFIQVGESMEKPLEYYRNNVDGFLTLLECMREYNCRKIIFSSTCTVFGNPTNNPLDENNIYGPLNPYAETKQICEYLLKRVDFLDYVLFRYFNVAGAAPDGSIGEDHRPESHLIPLVLQVPNGQRESIAVFGDDYPTKDGTGIRDYIHVADIAKAHVCACQYLSKGGKSDDFNLGNGKGFSVYEVINSCRRITGHPIPVVVKPRRAGDATEIYSSSKKAHELLGWEPDYTDLDSIVETAWKWHHSHPNGYAE